MNIDSATKILYNNLKYCKWLQSIGHDQKKTIFIYTKKKNINESVLNNNNELIEIQNLFDIRFEYMGEVIPA